MDNKRQMKLSELGGDFSNPAEESDLIVCPTCGKNDFNSEHGLKIHHTTVHNDRSLTLEERVQFKCEGCGSTQQLTPDEAERRKFCSYECKSEWQSEAYSGEDSPNWVENVSVECSVCGTTEERNPSQVNDTNFCSVSCEAKWKSENRAGENHPNWNGGDVSVECTWCGDNLSRPKWQASGYEHHFCNNDCRGSYYSSNPSELHEKERVTVFCEWCGNDKNVIHYYAERNERHFCNRKCRGKWRSENIIGESHPNWKGGYEPYYGTNWDQKRREAMERDEYQCALCGLTDEASKQIHGRELDVHHVIRLNDFENPVHANVVSNLLTVCILCHQRVFD